MIQQPENLPTFIHGQAGWFHCNYKDISGLRAVSIYLTITDNNFCTATETFDLTEPDVLGMTVSLSSSIAGGFNINCAGDIYRID